ncbi:MULTISPECIES: rhodanese-like domain-containing protein [Nocardia]|jgi:rhodanese-related sulfurtransferase|uniref:Rhodanese-like domain-containing protein n=1 Tax=Nocardia gamkensis TaxID=352869 RepID=A0A7X6L1V2_9NOCA|nr:rhodanese-like domain-containing protein [Nocardia gamkensis]NKY26294.1 rhodanese-like domain-containing protein [Nocardia gamkensis]NQE67881.1 Hydroxyacylglutathione hydrolase [Nocardia gamkensis]
MSTGAEDMVARARARLERVTPEQAAAVQSRGGLIVDIRPHANRIAEGEIPGAVVVERIVLEWRLDPNGDHRLPSLTSDTPVVIVCNEGYASSLAAADGLRLGLRRVTDLVGGFRAWKAAGLPVVAGGTPAVP